MKWVKLGELLIGLGMVIATVLYFAYVSDKDEEEKNQKLKEKNDGYTTKRKG